MIIPHGIHDVHGTTNWLRLQPTLIPWIPHGIPDGFHGFHMDSIWINPGKVKTSTIHINFCDDKVRLRAISWSWITPKSTQSISRVVTNIVPCINNEFC
jgi:hypothetical protein